MRLDPMPPPIRPSSVPPPPPQWPPLVAGMILAVVGLLTITFFGLTTGRLLFGLAGIGICWWFWPEHN